VPLRAGTEVSLKLGRFSETARALRVPEWLVKMPRYASGNIPVYWIVNLVDLQVEVYTNPAGATYTDRTVFTRGQEIPVVIDGRPVGRIAVSEILP
jgi:Putative restriction endonuclease